MELKNTENHDESRQGESLLIESNTANTPTKKLYLESYGCQMNFADSEVVTSILLENGYATTSNLKEAETILIGLIDRVRMLDNDLIRLNQKINIVLMLREIKDKK